MTQPPLTPDAGPVVVTGGGGFVGSGICLAFAQAGFAVVAIDRAFDGTPPHPLIRHVTTEVTELADWPCAVPALVIHGAAITTGPQELGLSAAAHIALNLNAHLHVMQLARRKGAGRFVFLSSTGVFNATDGDTTLTEAAIPTGTSPYAAAKRAGEIATLAAAEPGFATLSLRLGYIFGPDERLRPTRTHLSLVARMWAQAQTGDRLVVVEGDTRREWAWLPDLARGIVALCREMPDSGILHAGTPPVLCDWDLARLIAARHAGAMVVRRGAPAGPVKPPMASILPSPLTSLAWTDMARALDQMIAHGDER